MFLSGTLSVELLLIFVLALLFIAGVGLLVKVARRGEVLPLSALSHMNFYCKNLRNGEEFFSKKLCMALGKDKVSGLSAFYELFDEESREVLASVFSRVKDAHSYGVEKEGAEYCKPITFYNKDKDIKQHFICSYSHITDPNNNNLLKIFVFFHDVSGNVELVKGLKHENDVLKADLLFKNNVLNALPFPVWVRDSSLKLCYFNNHFNYFIPHDQECIDNVSISPKEEELAKKAQSYGVIQVSEIYVVINGQRQLYNFHEIPVSGMDLLLGVGYNCEDKDQIRSELQRHMAAQSDLLESTASAVAIYGPDMNLRFFNHAFVKMWGLEERWLLTQPSYAQFLDKLRAERKLPEQADFQQFKQEQISLFTDLTLTHNDFLYLPDGRSLRAIVIPHALGGLLFSYEDMTDRLALERSYNTLTAVQKSTIDHLNEGVTVFSEDGRLQVSNDQFSKIWNISSEVLGSKPHLVTLVDKIVDNVCDAEGNISFKDEFFACINARKTKSLSVKKNDDSVIDVLFVPLPDGATLVCYRDITDNIMVEQMLVEKNKALQQADTLKTEFLANMSYELRSPLTSIIGFSGILEGSHCGKLNKKQHEYVSAINNSSKYLMSLINDILDIASIEAGYMSLDVEKVDFRSPIEMMVELVSQGIKQNNIKMNVFYSHKTFYGIGDVKRIKQVIFKMLNNAVGRVKSGGDLSFFVRCIQKYLVLVIKDNGSYVPEGDQRQIFNKFYGVSNADVANNKDNLGMSLVKSIIEMHGGRVSFVSKKGDSNILRAIIPLNNKELLSDHKLGRNTVEQMVN